MAYVNLQPATAGMLDGMQSNNIESWPAAGQIRFGMAVLIEADGTCKQASNKEADGVAVLSQVMCGQDASSGLYNPKQIVAVLRSGRIWGAVTGPVAIGDVLGVDASGRFSKAAAAANAPDRLTIVARSANASGNGQVIIEVTPK